MQKTNGFNLLEILIVLTIIGILSALCLPVYSEHIIRARRLEAEINLIKLANALEKYYLLNNTYENATLNQLHFSQMIANNQYQLQIVAVSSSEFSIKAEPQGKQTDKDVVCGSLLLNSSGNKGITGNSTVNECWQ